ncbi:hypothetical protein DFP94_101167 [Fontibacillus phaseoli]|uniref:Uncharacterized protein n=1 Tax=Fontibacillus phaseoli TaxID=1416533 RepID=A0A369BQ51_9BACL|nr:hypothetical protein [Fontibacillus phaseoli]RCX22587.1 hypothetical protein DFP94_101167 [Fontibacillus phaseoli]
MNEVTVNRIREGVMTLLTARFPDIGVYGGEQTQDGQTPQSPCFLLKLLTASQEQELGRRYNRTLSFLIQYIPEAAQRGASLHETAESLFELFREAVIDETRYFGSKMKYEIVEKSLHFFFSFHFLVWQPAPEGPKMQSLEEEGHIKHGN